VIQNALNECGLEDKVEGYGLLKLNGADFTPLKLIRGDISIIYPGPKPAAKPDRDSLTSEDDEPRKRKAHKRQRRPQRAKQQGGRTAAAAADSDRGGESDSGHAQLPSAGTAVAAAPAPQRTEDVAALQQVQAIATQLGIVASSTDFVIAIKALQDGTAAAQRERAEALATSQIAADSRAELQAAVSAGQKERHDLDVRAGQLSAENADLKAKLSTAECQLTSSKTALTSVGAELEQKSDANAVLTADNTEFEKRAAATAKTAALVSKKLCSALTMLKEALPHEVSSVWSNYSFYCSTMLVHA
jgi:DNA repair exonuclease SbcCD ATPase subunit